MLRVPNIAQESRWELLERECLPRCRVNIADCPGNPRSPESVLVSQVLPVPATPYAQTTPLFASPSPPPSVEPRLYAWVGCYQQPRPALLDESLRTRTFVQPSSRVQCAAGLANVHHEPRTTRMNERNTLSGSSVSKNERTISPACAEDAEQLTSQSEKILLADSLEQGRGASEYVPGLYDVSA